MGRERQAVAVEAHRPRGRGGTARVDGNAGNRPGGLATAMRVDTLDAVLKTYAGSQDRWQIVQAERNNPLSRRLEWL